MNLTKIESYTLFLRIIAILMTFLVASTVIAVANEPDGYQVSVNKVAIGYVDDVEVIEQATNLAAAQLASENQNIRVYADEDAVAYEPVYLAKNDRDFLSQNQLAQKLKAQPIFECDAWILKVNNVNMFATSTQKIANDIIAGVKSHYFNSKYNVQSVTLKESITSKEGRVKITSLKNVDAGVKFLVKKPYVTATIKLKGPDLGSGALAKPMATLQTSSAYGNRGGTRHLGIDFRNPKGTAIYATGNGTVVQSGYSGTFGNLIKIDHGNGLQTWYAHCEKLLVPVGTKVTRAQQIATVGSTGNATGNHLHYEVRLNGVSQNPWSYM